MGIPRSKGYLIMNARVRLLLVVAIASVSAFLTYQAIGAQSLSYAAGQTISPAYEGWEENPDGSFNFLFGYMNRNWQEEIDVPVGPDNTLEPGGPDQGQPTHFLPAPQPLHLQGARPQGLGRERVDLDAHDKRGNREGLRDAPARFEGRRCRQGVRDGRPRRRHQQSGSAVEQAARQ